MTINILENGGSLEPGDLLQSLNGNYKLIFQSTDGNLVLYEGESKVLWSSGTINDGATETIMQTDGNLVIYNAKKEPLFASNTSGNEGAFLLITDDGTIQINNGFKVIWQKP